MNIFYKYTNKTLKKNRMRTFMTILGIVLSMALMTAVAEGAYSGICYLRNIEMASNGKYHLILKGVDGNNTDRIDEDGMVSGYCLWNELGYGNIDSANQTKPYLRVISAETCIGDYVPVVLTEGRMPENENEIILPVHIFEEKERDINVEDRLNIDLGKRILNKDADVAALSEHFYLDENEALYFEATERTGYAFEVLEMLTETQPHTYTVTGFFERLPYEIEPYMCPGYTAITVGSKAEKNNKAFVILEDPVDTDEFIKNADYASDAKTHRSLIRLYLSGQTNEFLVIIYGFASILLLIVSIGTISMIYNSFSISVSERTKEFGILKSLGATGKQVRKAVLYEAALMAGIGIPAGALIGCAGIGITLSALSGAFEKIIFEITSGQGGYDEVRMQLELNLPAIAIAAVVCLVTTIIAAWIPSHRARKVTAMDAVRQNQEIRIDPKKTKSSRLTYRLFGIEGTLASKNFKRSRKKYRTTVFSLSVSIILFISATVFCSYLEKSVDSIAGSRLTADSLYYIGEDTYRGMLENGLLEQETTEHVFYYTAGYSAISMKNEYASAELKKFWEQLGIDESEDRELAFLPILLDDENFEKVCSESGIDSKKYFEGDSLKGITVNRFVEAQMDEDGGVQWLEYEAFDVDSLPVESGLIYYTYDEPDVTGDVDSYDSVKYETEIVSPEYVVVAADNPKLKKHIVPIYIEEVIDEDPLKLYKNSGIIYLPYSQAQRICSDSLEKLNLNSSLAVFFGEDKSRSPKLESFSREHEKKFGFGVINNRDERESLRMILDVINVFSYGFIILISLISLTNVFNSVSTNMLLRTREFAMLRSIGLSDRGYRKMMRYECLIYGLRGIMWGLPAAIGMDVLIYLVMRSSIVTGFIIPWMSIAVSVGAVFVVVTLTMLYSAGKIRKKNIIDAVRNENN